jgi:hypothetical protein
VRYEIIMMDTATTAMRLRAENCGVAVDITEYSMPLPPPNVNTCKPDSRYFS